MWRDFYSNFLGHFSGRKAFSQASEQNRLERFFTFPSFRRSAQRCGLQLQEAGLSRVEVESFPADGATSWYGWKSMTAWDVTEARLWMTEPRREPLCDWSVVPESLVMYSGPCKAEAELVPWDGEADVDLSGKIPFTRHHINDVYPQMRARDVRGILSDFLGTLPGVRAEINSRVYDGAFHSATGVIPGAEQPEKEILFVSHLYEPGANDNASGSVWNWPAA